MHTGPFIHKNDFVGFGRHTDEFAAEFFKPSHTVGSLICLFVKWCMNTTSQEGTEIINKTLASAVLP